MPSMESGSKERRNGNCKGSRERRVDQRRCPHRRGVEEHSEELKRGELVQDLVVHQMGQKLGKGRCHHLGEDDATASTEWHGSHHISDIGHNERERGQEKQKNNNQTHALRAQMSCKTQPLENTPRHA